MAFQPKVEFSRLRVTTAAMRKTCRWCGNRVFSGVTVRGRDVIKGFICYGCVFDVSHWLSRDLEQCARSGAKLLAETTAEE